MLHTYPSDRTPRGKSSLPGYSGAVAVTRVRRTQRERSEATIGDVVAAARRLFASEGYAGTSLDAVAAEVGVTRGAVYHHFASKRELFRAVYERERERLGKIEVEAYRRKRDPWEGLIAASVAYLEASTDPEVQRITLLDAPGALGWDTMRETRDRDAIASMRIAVSQAMDAGRLRRRPIDPIVHLLHGAICESAIEVARADDQTGALRAASTELRRLLRGFADA